MNVGRVRIGLVGAAMTVVALAAGGIFDRWVMALLLAAALPTAVAIVLQPRNALARGIGFVASIAASTTLAVVVSGGGRLDVGEAFVGGAQGLLTTDWPSPMSAPLVGATALLLAAATAIGCELAGRVRWHLLPLVPVVAAHTVVIALSAPLAARLAWLIPLGVIFAIHATLRPDRVLVDRWTVLRGERRLIPIVLLAALIAATVSVPVALAARADPRRNDPAATTAPLLDPIESTLALRAIEPPIELHRITTGEGTPLPRRWRTAALTEFDGQRWTPALTLRPIGRRLGPDAPDAIAFDVFFLDDDLVLVPLPGIPVTVDADVHTDPERTVVRLADRRAPTDPLRTESRVAPSAIDGAADVATRPVDESVSGLAEFASVLAGDGTVVEQLRRIESTMRDEWVLASNAPGGGLQRALVERFLRDTKRGTAEQFSTGFVLLARSLGVDARVATGFVSESATSAESIVLRSSDAVVWPEVRLLSGGWVAFDPVPETEASDSTPPLEEPATQTPAAAQPPIAPPPEPNTDTLDDEAAPDDTSATTLSSLTRWAVRVGLGLSALVVPVLLAMAVILAIKLRRRRRLLTASAPQDRVVGAWAIATDRLVDAGLGIRNSATDGDIAVSGTAVAASAHRELAHLAALASAVTFGHPPRPDRLADDAVAYLERVETSMATERSRRERWRWRLSLRSLRRATRSPLHL